MKAAFYLCWAIWWIGAAVGYFAHWPKVQAVSNTLFGPLTILLALVWAGRWIWRKAAPKLGTHTHPTARGQRAGPGE